MVLLARRNEVSTFVAYTPGGKGLSMRDAFLPMSVNQRGRRIAGSPAYRNDQAYMDMIEF